MRPFDLRKFLGRKEVQQVLENWSATVGRPWAVLSNSGESLYGTSVNVEDRVPLAAGGQTLGWVAGRPPEAGRVAQFLNLLVQEESEKAALTAELLERYREVSLYYDLGERLAAAGSFRETLGHIGNRVKRLTGADGLCLFVWPEQGERGEYLSDDSHAFSESDTGEGAENVRRLRALDHPEIANHPVRDPRLASLAREGESLMAVPLGQAKGFILLRKRNGRVFSSTDLKFTATLAAQLAAHLEIARVLHLLRESEKSLQRINVELEARVADRTRLLQDEINERKASERALEAQSRLLRQRSAELAEANQELDRVARAKSEFLASMSHEIRTPLTGILGMTTVLLETSLDEVQLDYARTIKSCGDALLSVVNDILDLSKIEADRMELDIQDMDLRLALEPIIDVLGLKARQKGLDFACVIHHDIPSRLRGDPGRLRQVLLNLAGNAVKFTDQGKVLIRAEAASESPGNVTVQFAVTDTGIGIPADRLDKLFRPFAQADVTTTTRYGGTGLGLTIAGRLVDLMGGRISVSSREGAGTTFTFTAVFGRQEGGEPTPHPVSDSIQGVRVLLVDDQATSRQVIGEYLRGWGVRFDEALTAEEAIRKMGESVRHSDPYQVLLIYRELADGNGEFLGQTIRKVPEYDGTTLVLITAVGMAGDAARLQSAGFSAYLKKPLKYSNLRDCLRTVLAGPSPVLTGSREIVTGHSLKEDRKHRFRILVAEDNPVNRAVIRKLLENLGYAVHIVEDGRQVVEASAAGAYDLVFMDVQMPEMDGITATRAIRQRERETGVRVTIAALTANATREHRAECIKAGMDFFISKPFQPEQIEQLLEELVEGKESIEMAAPELPLPAGVPPAEAPPARPEAPSDSEPRVIFDSKRLLQYLGGSVGMEEIIDAFLEDTAIQKRQMALAMESTDFSLLRRAAHAMKGAAANVGADCLSHRAAQVESAAVNKDREGADRGYRKLLAEIDLFAQEALKARSQG